MPRLSLRNLKNNLELRVKIWKITGVFPIRIVLYEHALGYSRRRKEFERLEFLGDRMLDAVVSYELFRRYRRASEGMMSIWKAWICSRNSLNRLAYEVGLVNLMNREWLEQGGVNAPGDTLEALLGAIYIDRGWGALRRATLKWLGGYLALVGAFRKRDVPLNYKGKVMEWAQKNGKRVVFKTEEQSDYEKRFVCTLLVDEKPVTVGAGRKKKQAEEEAAKAWLEKLTRG